MRTRRTDPGRPPNLQSTTSLPASGVILRKRRPRSTPTTSEVKAKRRRLSRNEELYCEDCGHSNQGDCPVHGPLTPLDETQGKDRKSVKYTSVFVPKQLTVRESSIPNAGLGVFANMLIPNRFQCGPYKGDVIATSDVTCEMDPSYMWEIKEGDEVTFVVDGKDLSTANWMRYANCSRSVAEQNMVAFQYKGNMFYKTCRSIQPGEELLVWYGDAYARELGIDTSPADAEHNNEEEVDLGTRNEFNIAYKCLGCESAFVEHLSFKIHLKNNNSCDLANPQTFTCQQCAATFGRLFQLQFHIRQHLAAAAAPKKQRRGSAKSPINRIGNKPYKCTFCDYCCSRSSHLKTHLCTHTGDKPYKCTHCDYCSIYRGHLKRHLRTHTGDKPYKCTYCDYCCSQSSNLKTHLCTHTGDKPYKCTHCDYCSSLSRNLERHLRTHTGDKPYKCTYCDYYCSLSSNLNTHLCTHTGDKPYKCTHCDYCSSCSRNLKTHLRTHTGDKPYKCTYCDYCCSQSSTLKTHIRTHTGDKPYKCTYCDYCSSTCGHLKAHIRTHTGDKPYKCTYCDYCCNQSSNLKAHLRTHTR